MIFNCARERASFVEFVDGLDEASKMAVREARLVNFRIGLSPRIIRQLVTGEDKNEFRVRARGQVVYFFSVR